MSTKTAYELQKEFGSLYGSKDAIIWDLFRSNQKKFLYDKIKLTIADAPGVDIDDIFNDKQMSLSGKHEKATALLKEQDKENEKIEEYRQKLVEIVWQQTKYNNKNLFMAIIFVVCVPENESGNLNTYRNSQQFSCHQLFRIRKCITNDNSEDCCMIFVDENCRVYQNWDDYKANNELPEGIVIAPKKGVYKVTENDDILIEYFKSVASKITTKLVKAGDTSASILGFAASTVPAAALVTTVALPFLVPSAVVGAGVGIWSVGRSIGNLVDRENHEQTINVTDREARSGWLGIAGGIIGIVASGATQGVARLASRGNEVSGVVRTVVTGLNGTSLLINGVAVGNGVVELYMKYRDDEKISILDVVQLSSSLFLFTHSVYNFTTATQLVENTRDGTIKSFRDQLSNKQKKTFDKLFRDTISINGADKGKIDIIRCIKNVPDAKQYLNDVTKIKKSLNKANITATFGSEGKVMLNNNIAVNSEILRSNIQFGSGDILDTVPNIPAPSTSSNFDSNNINALSLKSILDLPTEAKVTQLILVILKNCHRISSIPDLEDCLCYLYTKFAEPSVTKLITMAKEFVNVYGRELENLLKLILPLEQVLGDSVEILTNLHLTVQAINNFILEMDQSTFTKMIKDFYMQMVSKNKQIKCKKCSGYFSITNVES